MEFQDWIKQKYFEWRGDTVRRHSISSFARFIGVSQQVMNDWINTGKKPGRKTLEKLAMKYPEVYGVLGLPSPEDTHLFINYPPEVAERARRALRELNTKYATRGNLNKKESETLAIEVFAKHGFTQTSTGKEDSESIK